MFILELSGPSRKGGEGLARREFEVDPLSLLSSQEMSELEEEGF